MASDQTRHRPRPLGDPARSRARRAPASCASCRSTLIKPNPDQPRTNFDAGGTGRAGRLDRGQRRRPAAARPPPPRRQLRARRRRAPLARRPAGRAWTRSRPSSATRTEAERLQAALIENMVREDLNPVEEAKACAALVEDLGLTKEELARRVGRSRPAVSNLIRLLELPDEALAMLESGELSEGHGRALLGGPGQRRPPPPRPRRGGGGMVGPRDREQGSAGRPAKGEAEAGAGRPRRARPRSRTPATRSRRRSATRSRCGQRAAASSPSSASTTSSEAHALARRLRKRS